MSKWSDPKKSFVAWLASFIRIEPVLRNYDTMFMFLLPINILSILAFVNMTIGVTDPTEELFSCLKSMGAFDCIYGLFCVYGYWHTKVRSVPQRTQ